MKNYKLYEKLIRYALGILLLFVAVNAFAGGYYGMAGAKNVPTDWLAGSPFRDYLIPSLILFLFVGGSTLIAAIFVFRRNRIASRAAFICGIIIFLWLIVQISIIGYVSWMQPTTAAAALIIIFLTWRLQNYGY